MEKCWDCRGPSVVEFGKPPVQPPCTTCGSTGDADWWEPERVAKRLVGMSSSAGAVVWARGVGFVRVTCVQARRQWQMTPVEGAWQLLAGADDQSPGFWTAVLTKADGGREELQRSTLGATTLLWDLLDLLQDRDCGR